MEFHAIQCWPFDVTTGGKKVDRLATVERTMSRIIKQKQATSGAMTRQREKLKTKHFHV